MALDFEKNRQEVERRLKELTKYCMISGALDLNLYQEYDVKRGLRESSGKGVLTGLTESFRCLRIPCGGGKTDPHGGPAVLSGL